MLFQRSQIQLSRSQLPATPAPGGPVLSSDLCGTNTHMHTHTCIYTNKNKKFKYKTNNPKSLLVLGPGVVTVGAGRLKKEPEVLHLT